MKKKSAARAAVPPPFRLVRKLGQGGAGQVYLVEDPLREGRKVALKLVEAKRSREAAVVASLKNEFETLARLRHPNLARVYDFGQGEAGLFFTSEWIDGEDLLSASSSAHLNTVFHLIVQILRALDFLHRRGVLHLDLKPANILVTDPDRTGDLRVKLIDFGIAQWIRGEPKADGAFSGTPPFAAPEILMEQAPNPATDLYALGVILYLLFTGEFPFSTLNPMELMKEQLYGEPRPPRRLNPALPDTFGQILLRMVAKRVEDRFQSPTELLEAINRCLGEDFTLLSAMAPVQFLEASDYFFRTELIDELAGALTGKEVRRILLQGAAGMGKTRLLTRLKELLQLKGIGALFFSNPASLRSFLEAAVPDPKLPLLLDFSRVEAPEWENLFSRLRDIPNAWVLAAERIPPEGASAGERLELASLEFEPIRGFLEKEIAEFPLELHAANLSEQCGGSPRNLEIALRELREQGCLQWGDAGWKWVPKEDIAMEALLPAHERRWSARRDRIVEILKFSSTGLSVQTLEGIIGLGSGGLGEYLERWEAEGSLERREVEAVPFYFSVDRVEATFKKKTEDASRLAEEWKRLYERGEFEAGALLAEDFFLQMPAGEVVEPSLKIWGGRHFVATGRNERALQILPDSAPADAALAGLYHEIRARAVLNLGKFSDTQDSLEQAQKIFTDAADFSGCARVANLQAMVGKGLGRFDLAEEHFKNAIATAQAVPDSYLEGLFLMNLGVLYQDQGRLQEADETYQRAVTSAQASQHPLLVLGLKQNRINLLYYMGRSAEAEAACYDLLQLALQRNYPERQAAAWYYLALLAGQKGQLELKRAYLNRAIGLLDAKKSPQLWVQCLTNRSYVSWDLGKHLPAQLDAEAALDVALARAHPFLLAWPYLLLGRILRDRPKPDWKAAGEHLEKALQIIQQFENRQLLWEVEWDLGLWAKQGSERSQALEHFEKAREHLEALLPQIPEAMRASYLRDRKLEKVLKEIEGLKNSPRL